MVDERGIWSGWKLVEAEKAAGGAEARAYNRLAARRKRQKQVIELLGESRKELLEGQQGIEIGADEVERWMAMLTDDGEASIYEIRDQVNFLALGLSRGKKELGWIVTPPAPISLLPRPTSPFTIDSFANLGDIRDWQRHTEAELISNKRLHKAHAGSDVSESAAEVSWGTFIYIAMTRDGFVNTGYINALPLFAASLSMGKGMAWITLFDDELDDERIKKRLIRRRWILGPAALAFLLRHISTFGYPACKNNVEAERFTKRSWSAFCGILKVKKITFPAFAAKLETAYGLCLPPYLLGGLRGRASSTSIAERRWRQLLQNGRELDESIAGSIDDTDKVGKSRLVLSSIDNDTADLEHGAEVLKALRRAVYKPRNERRPSYKEVSARLSSIEKLAQSSASIVHALSLWVIELHKEKLKISSMYRYVGAIGAPLLYAVGSYAVARENLPLLANAYETILDSAKTAKTRNYRSIVIMRFHNFLVKYLGFPSIQIEADDKSKITVNADANLISEQEYDLIFSALVNNDKSIFAENCYWIFILGYRAGLRVSEALSIALRDIQMPDHNLDGAEIVLLVRQNQYVDVKSYDSRRMLPLQLLLTEAECADFRSFYLGRCKLYKRMNVMLFSSGSRSTAPLLDRVVHEYIHEAMRVVTGDHSLRFQHLRHTFANNLLMAYHEVSPPWPSPQHLRGVMGVLGSSHTRKGLYFIAQLLGHASPSTTLKSYTHCLELIHREYLGTMSEVAGCKEESSTPEAQLRPFLNILGIKPATLRKWKQRYGDDFSQWLRHGFPEVPVAQIVEDSLQPYREVEVSIDPFRRIDELSLHELETILFAEGHSAEELETIFRLEKGMYDFLKHAYSNVLLIPSKKRPHAFRHARPSVYYPEKRKAFQDRSHDEILLQPPRGEPNNKLASEIFSKLFHRKESGPHNDLLREHLLYFHAEHRARDGYVYIQNIEESCEFIKWLSSLHKDVALKINVMASQRSEISPESQVSFWKKTLSGCTGRVDVELVGAGTRIASPYGTGKLKFHMISKSSEKRRKSLPREDIDNSWAVRYALVMGCVLMTAIKSHQQSTLHQQKFTEESGKVWS